MQRSSWKNNLSAHPLPGSSLAKKVGVRRETIVFIEKGDYNCSIFLAHALAKELKTTIDKLFIWKD